jgi:leucyl-tRNA synthetase
VFDGAWGEKEIDLLIRLAIRRGWPLKDDRVKQRLSEVATNIAEIKGADLGRVTDLETNEGKVMQKNWIGKSFGCEVSFSLENFEDKIEVFTTRPDTIFGVNFLVLAPEHDLVEELTKVEQKKEIEKYVNTAKLKSERYRQADKNVSGVFRILCSSSFYG